MTPCSLAETATRVDRGGVARGTGISRARWPIELFFKELKQTVKRQVIAGTN